VYFIPNKVMDVIFLCKPVNKIIFVLINSFNEIRSDPSIKSAVSFAAEDINIKMLHFIIKLIWIPAFAGMTIYLNP